MEDLNENLLIDSERVVFSRHLELVWEVGMMQEVKNCIRTARSAEEDLKNGFQSAKQESIIVNFEPKIHSLLCKDSIASNKYIWMGIT